MRIHYTLDLDVTPAEIGETMSHFLAFARDLAAELSGISVSEPDPEDPASYPDPEN